VAPRSGLPGADLIGAEIPRPERATARSQYVGKLTNRLVYEKLPPGILEQLRQRNPALPGSGRRRWKHHQFLSEDLGQPDLRDHLL
jgi:hypothetical protein